MKDDTCSEIVWPRDQTRKKHATHAHASFITPTILNCVTVSARMSTEYTYAPRFEQEKHHHVLEHPWKPHRHVRVCMRMGHVIYTVCTHTRTHTHKLIRPCLPSDSENRITKQLLTCRHTHPPTHTPTHPHTHTQMNPSMSTVGLGK